MDEGCVCLRFRNRPVQAGKSTASEWRVFAIYYDDWRHIAKADNRPVAVKAADLANIRIGTYGADYLQVTQTPLGALDWLGEFALQNGAWGAQAQRAAMVDLEAGFQPKILRGLKPWV